MNDAGAGRDGGGDGGDKACMVVVTRRLPAGIVSQGEVGCEEEKGDEEVQTKEGHACVVRDLGPGCAAVGFVVLTALMQVAMVYVSLKVVRDALAPSCVMRLIGHHCGSRAYRSH